jgi:hypothetical protein
MSIDSLKTIYDSANPVYDSSNPMYDSEYHISYDTIYDENVKIPTKSNECVKNQRPYFKKNMENTNFICGFYHHSKYFLLYLFLMLAMLIGVMYAIVYISK